jgi:hypothetical protein
VLRGFVGGERLPNGRAEGLRDDSLRMSDTEKLRVFGVRDGNRGKVAIGVFEFFVGFIKILELVRKGILYHIYGGHTLVLSTLKYLNDKSSIVLEILENSSLLILVSQVFGVAIRCSKLTRTPLSGYSKQTLPSISSIASPILAFRFLRKF